MVVRPVSRSFPTGAVINLGVTVAVFLATPPVFDAGPRTISFEGRVRAQRAIEGVYASHRLWPEANTGARPTLADVLSEEALRSKVGDYLRKSSALEALWGRPITADQLQAEIERMARSTRRPQVLRELFAALDDDPFLIAECLARPALADRLVRSWYSADERFHGDVRRRARAEHEMANASTDARSLGDRSRERFVRKVETERGAFSDRGSEVLGPADWDEHVSWLRKEIGARSNEALPVGTWSPLVEDFRGLHATVVLRAGLDHVETATVTWAKTGFDEWWASSRTDFAADPGPAGGSYELPATIDGGGCADDTWSETLHDAPDPRQYMSAVWTGAEMVLWGGDGNPDNGWRYDPATDTWTRTNTVGAPSSRILHTAVWTGTEMIVWGGNSSDSSGGRYDPVTDTWTPTTLVGAPSARTRHAAVWTGTEMIVWGGAGTNTGGRYDPATDTWTSTTTVGAPSGRDRHTAVWTGTEMIVWGGDYLDTGGRYDPGSDSWTPTTTTGAPVGRRYHTGVWTGSEMIIWGGEPQSNDPGEGGRYDPVTDSWTATSVTNAPTGRRFHTSVWTGDELIVWGGAAGAAYVASDMGGRYDPDTDSWTSTSLTNAAGPRQQAAAVWTGTEMIVWGGLSEIDRLRGDGGRYDPATDTWVATGVGTVPTPRQLHTAVWTGSEMIVWGGIAHFTEFDTGGRYDPALNLWSPTTTTDAPSPRTAHTAVWTGSEMIVWGGEAAGNDITDTGGRYDPPSNTWTPTTTTAAPDARLNHTALWTGSEMIVWGGFSIAPAWTNTGGRYDPSSDTWTATSLVDAPEGRDSHSAVLTGSEMIVWGGRRTSAGHPLGTGGRYDLAGDSWTATTFVDAPADRRDHVAVWTGSEMIVWGGSVSSTEAGGSYDPPSDTWSAITNVGAPQNREDSSAIWTGSEMIVWRVEGGRYNPSADTWKLTSSTGAPFASAGHTAVWTGAEMIVWGGGSQKPTSTGHAYCACATLATFYRDVDDDGFGIAAETVIDCAGTPPAGYAAVAGDCDDDDDTIYPGQVESCNGVDDDCDTLVDEDGLGEDTDADTVHNACDNCNVLYNPSQSDFDVDLEGDHCDLDDGMIYVTFGSQTSLEWQTESGYATWNAYRGDFADLVTSGLYTQLPGSNAYADSDCDLGSPQRFDNPSIATGDLAIYLVTGETAGGVESDPGDSTTGPRPHDNPCP